jgi:hypothetical protein
MRIRNRSDHIGILEKIGEGGMGIIYKAEQRQPVRRAVALKVIKLGMDTRSTTQSASAFKVGSDQR